MKMKVAVVMAAALMGGCASSGEWFHYSPGYYPPSMPGTTMSPARAPKVYVETNAEYLKDTAFKGDGPELCPKAVETINASMVPGKKGFIDGILAEKAKRKAAEGK